jgi:hypothetical protein
MVRHTWEGGGGKPWHIRSLLAALTHLYVLRLGPPIEVGAVYAPGPRWAVSSLWLVVGRTSLMSLCLAVGRVMRRGCRQG